MSNLSANANVATAAPRTRPTNPKRLLRAATTLAAAHNITPKKEGIIITAILCKAASRATRDIVDRAAGASPPSLPIRRASVAAKLAIPLMVAVTACGTASAQSYYARERVIGNAQRDPDTGSAWQIGEWSAPSASCSEAAQQTRTVSCQRPDGALTRDAACNPASRPASSQTVAELSGCTFSRGPVVSHGPWSSTCSETAARVEHHSCLRSDGAIVPDWECTSRGTPLNSTSAPAAIHVGCSYAWQTGSWGAYSSECSEGAARIRAVSCRRSDGFTASDVSCASVGAKPATTETAAQYSGCSFSWRETARTCETPGNTGYATATYQCQRSGGSSEAVFLTDPASLAQCGVKPSPRVADPACAPADLIANGGFEASGGWTVNMVRTQDLGTGTHVAQGGRTGEGAMSLFSGNQGGGQIEHPAITLLGGRSYLYSAWVRNVGQSSRPVVLLRLAVGGRTFEPDNYFADSSWQRMQLRIRAPYEMDARPQIQVTSRGATVLIDDVSVVEAP